MGTHICLSAQGQNNTKVLTIAHYTNQIYILYRKSVHNVSEIISNLGNIYMQKSNVLVRLHSLCGTYAQPSKPFMHTTSPPQAQLRITPPQ
jgi:hypothetical protein